MGKRTGGKRSAPVGNRNRLSHGRYSARRIARRKEVQASLPGSSIDATLRSEC